MEFSEEMNKLGMMLVASNIIKVFGEMADDAEKASEEVQQFFKIYEDKVVEHALDLEKVFGKIFFSR